MICLFSGAEPILFRVLRPLDGNHSSKITKTIKKGAMPSKSADASARTDPLANSRLLITNAPCSSLRHGRSDVDSVRRDVEFGVILSAPTNADCSLADLYANPPQDVPNGVVFSDWAVGDVVQCYRIVRKAQSIDWTIDNPQVNS